MSAERAEAKRSKAWWSLHGLKKGGATSLLGVPPKEPSTPVPNLPPNAWVRVRESVVRRAFESWVGWVFVWALGAWALPTPVLGASMPPKYRFQTLQAGRIRLHFHAEVERPARRTMALVLEILPRLEARYRVRVPSLDVMVHDAYDSPNGLATAFPYPLVEIRTASSSGADSGPTESWLRLVVTHELTHIVHIEQAGGIYGFGRRVFGRAPFLFPGALQPTWFIEGLAVREETRGTAFGRGRHTFTRMVVDEAARSGQLMKMDQATLGLDRWPLGNAPYLFGEEFLRFVESTHGEAATRDIAVSQAGSLRPYIDSPAFRKVTGKGLGELWREFADQRVAGLRPAGGVTTLTGRGAVQASPRLSPDGSTLAYTSRTLHKTGEIRLMSPHGGADRRLASRLSGTGLSWSRDGTFLVFDETNQVRKFESRSDLYRVWLSTGRRERLTTGLRASDPDVGPLRGTAGASIVFVQRFPDRSELSLLAEDGTSRTVTMSAPGTEWSDPRFSPSGDVVSAARQLGGFLDIVLVDPSSGVVTPVTTDRAVDAEPAWVDENRLVFRSDRQESSFRLFVVHRDGTGLRKVEGAPDNAFHPEIDAQATAVFYAHYSARGYDVARAPFVSGEAAGPYADPFDRTVDEPVPFEGEAGPYRPLRSLKPRFVSPFAEVVSDEWRLGLATASLDPLLRVTYGVAGSWGTRVSRPNGLAYLRYDGFTPTITAVGRFESSPSRAGSRDLAEGRVSIDFPLERSALRRQTLSLTARRRREDLAVGALDTGLLALGWQFDSTRTYPMSISPQDGFRLRLSALRELRTFGSDLESGKVIVDAARYSRLGRTALVTRLGAGWTFGSQASASAFGIGGLASPALLDPTGDEPAVLRGYKRPDGTDASRFGRRLGFGNLEWRIPLAHPQRGFRAFPLFLRHLSLAASVDAAVVSSRSLNLNSARVGVSLGLAAHLFIGHRIPLTLQGGVGKGLSREGRFVPWFQAGFPF